MKFYSYEYLLSKIEGVNIMQVLMAILLILTLVYVLIKYYKDRKDTKYRELAIIMAVGVLLFIGISVSEYQNTAISSNQYKASMKFIEDVSQHLGIEKEKIYINTAASVEGALVKVENNYYRVLNSGTKGEYLLEKIELINPNIELVEVKK